MFKKSNTLQKNSWYVGRSTRFLIQLIGHYLSTTFLFLSLASFAWLLSFAVAYLHLVYCFSDELLKSFTIFELCVVYGDSLLYAFLSFVGSYRFGRKVLGGNMKNELIEAFWEGFKMPFQILAEMYAFIRKLPSKILHRSAPGKPSEAPDPN